MDKRWTQRQLKLLDQNFDSNSEKERINHLKKYIQEHKGDENPITMKIGEMSVSVDSKDESKVSFCSVGNINSKTEDNPKQYQYNVTIKGKDIHSEVKIIDEKLHTNYFNKYNLGAIDISQTVTVINGEKINEIFSLSGEDKDKIIQELIKNHPEFTQENNDKFYREVVNPSLPIKQLEEFFFASNPNDFAKIVIDDKFNYRKLSDSYKERKSRQPIKTYGEGITIAKEIEEHCKYVYSLLMETDKTITETDPQDSPKIKNEMKERQVKQRLEKENITNVKLSKNGIDDYFNFLKTKQMTDRPNSYSVDDIDRMHSVIKLQNLIALSKNQDREIADLEQQLSTRGIEIDE